MSLFKKIFGSKGTKEVQVLEKPVEMVNITGIPESWVLSGLWQNTKSDFAWEVVNAFPPEKAEEWIAENGLIIEEVFGRKIMVDLSSNTFDPTKYDELYYDPNVRGSKWSAAEVVEGVLISYKEELAKQ